MKVRVLIAASASFCLLVVAGWYIQRARDSFNEDADSLVLLVPDATDFSDPRVTVWLDAASEEGLHVVPMSDSSFLRPRFRRPRYVGVILPDTVHESASDLLLEVVRKYVVSGGHLMLVYDAGAKSLQGFYPGDRSRLSDLAGVDYVLYQTLRDKMIRSDEVSGTIAVMDQLGVPPGKYFPFSFSASESADPSKDVAVPLKRYQYGDLEYPSFVTSGAYAGQVLLRSQAGIVAGRHPYGKGSVLFVNLPLGYLKSESDGLPLHVLLKFFAVNMLSLPTLSSVPDGVGGLVLNWHIDSNAAIAALQEMNTWTILQQGPYSMDVTAGPDTYEVGDKGGFDVLHNPVSQDLIHQYVSLGQEIGSHGGWIHNYFAHHVDTDNPKDLEKFLQLNKDALEQVTGKKVVEYSAPNGNQPVWVTHWLEAHGFVAYYFTGDTGMGPTQGYLGGHRSGQDIWAFPIAHMDRAASFEEMSAEDVSYDVIQQWLEALTDFVVKQEQVRLIYFHPPGILSFRDVVHNWLEKTAQLKAQGKFRWYTMAEMANFLNVRKRVVWKLTERDAGVLLEASAPETLAHMAWKFSGSKFARPSILAGSATIVDDNGAWLVVAGPENRLEASAQVLAK